MDLPKLPTPKGVKVVFEEGKTKYLLPPYNLAICPYEGFEWSDIESPIDSKDWDQMVSCQMNFLKGEYAHQQVLDISQSVTDQYMTIMGIAKKNLSKEDFEKVKANLQGLRLNGAKFGKVWMLQCIKC